MVLQTEGQLGRGPPPEIVWASSRFPKSNISPTPLKCLNASNTEEEKMQGLHLEQVDEEASRNFQSYNEGLKERRNTNEGPLLDEDGKATIL